MGQVTLQTKWYEFSQNNSGGHFVIDEKIGIGNEVFIEAIDTADAHRRAEAIGIYFDGCDDGRDCSCCGDRWSESRDWDAKDEAPQTGYCNDRELGYLTHWLMKKRIFVHPIGKPFYEIKAIG